LGSESEENREGRRKNVDQRKVLKALLTIVMLLAITLMWNTIRMPERLPAEYDRGFSDGFTKGAHDVSVMCRNKIDRLYDEVIDKVLSKTKPCAEDTYELIPVPGEDIVIESGDLTVHADGHVVGGGDRIIRDGW
jgi:hypothetical protein